MISIREAKDNDLPIVYELLQEFAEYLDEAERMTIGLDDFIECKDLYKCLLAETTGDKRVIGCTLFYYIFDSWTGKMVYIDDLYIKPEFRGHAVGKLMMSALIVMAKRNKCNKIEWTVRENNNGAIEFYRDFGANVGDDRLNCSIEL